ncbi:MAG: transcription termination factor Rho [Lachnospira sp.]
MRAKLETLSVSVLREFAKDKNIKNATSMKKSDLIDALLAAGGEETGTERSETENSGVTNVSPEGNSCKTAATKSQMAVSANKSVINDKKTVDSYDNVTQGVSESRTDYNSEDKSQNNTANAPAAHGILEVMPEGFGFIRCENFLPGENDVYVSPSQIRKFNLKTGDIIHGPKRPKTSADKFSALMYVESVNNLNPIEAQKRPAFESLTPIFPNERIHLEKGSGTVAMRMVDLISPIGKGQRGMIVSQPKSGKTTLLKQIANAITKNHPEMHLMILLIDERPEEVTDIKESIIGDNVEVIYSTFDELPERHKRVSEMVIERAKRLVEQRTDVVILLDSITRLARAYNLTVQASGRTLSGGLDPAALHMPKRFFGAARNMREGGSLTILATALVETGSKMDDVVFEEFKGTGNMELVLDRKLSEKRVFPAIDIAKSSTRREDLLLTHDELEAVDICRKALNGLKTDEAAERILDLFVKTRNNEEFVQNVRKNKYV